ncbi:MAG TPA: hypothetical protein EYQ61_10085 [Dehalococcoidia bacterium]|nr:hypothetical protein [Dehalococcoidia bacterium]HIK90343.1 hypothetical protein [Dehalococcoidia bacterium]
MVRVIHKYFWISNKLVATIFVVLAFALLTAMAGCGSSDDPQASEDAVLDEEGLRLTTKADAFYAIEDLKAVGFKTNRQFGVETVPGTTDIWYGFFQQRDIEVRFYESHEAAVEFGVEPAETIIARTAGQRDPLIPVVNLYPAYAVAGNTIMLCERQLSTCEALIDALPE